MSIKNVLNIKKKTIWRKLINRNINKLIYVKKIYYLHVNNYITYYGISIQLLVKINDKTFSTSVYYIAMNVCFRLLQRKVYYYIWKNNLKFFMYRKSY